METYRVKQKQIETKVFTIYMGGFSDAFWIQQYLAMSKNNLCIWISLHKTKTFYCKKLILSFFSLDHHGIDIESAEKLRMLANEHFEGLHGHG